MDKKVFSVYLGDPDRSNHAELDLPATPWELIDALDKLRLVDGREPYWQVEDIGRYGFLAPLLDDSDLYQFNALAEQLSTFDHVEAIAFEGLVQMEVDELCQTNGGELTLQRLLDLAYSVDGCHVVPGIRDDAALGRFYVENEFLPELEQVPDSVLELLDYAKIGERMRRDEHGAMTPNGYVVREAELRQAPPNLGRPPRKPPYMIRFLCASDTCAMRLDLPTTQTRLNAVLDALGVDSWQEVQLEECDTAMPEMWAFVDMAHLCKENIKEGTITYHRKKTGQKLVIGLESCMAEIIERYSSFTKDSDYVLPILHSDNPRNIQVQYYNALRYQNIQLKKIEKLLDIPHLHLTTYVPRHAWASIARENGVSLSVISEGMGHTSEKTTRIYLASLSQVVMDEANHKVLSSI